jgi:ribosomal protein S18 acetylase RimI-like enzyme
VQESLRVFDPRFVAFRQRFDIQADLARSRPTWWQNCTLGILEPLEFSVLEKVSGARVADALLMEMEGFSQRWNQPTAGIFSLRVDEPFRRQGIGKFMLAQMLRFVQEQCFELVEIQAPAENQGAVQLCRGLGFQQVDLGRVYKKDSELLKSRGS